MSSSDKTEHIAASTLPSFLFGVSGWSVSLFFLLKEADWPSPVYTCITTMQDQDTTARPIQFPQRLKNSCLVQDAAGWPADLR